MSARYAPTNSSKLRHSTSLSDFDSELSEPTVSITKSSLRRHSANPNLKAPTQPTAPPVLGKRTRASLNSVAATPQTNGRKSLIVALKYKVHGITKNEPLPFRDAEIFVTGQGAQGQLGVLSRKSAKGVPIKAETFDPFYGSAIVQIACGPSHCAAVTSEGTVLTWGSNALGALGRDTGRPNEFGAWKYSLSQEYVPYNPINYSQKDPQIDLESIPEEVDTKHFFDNVGIVQVACGSHKTFALTSDGYVYAWGSFVYEFKWKQPNMIVELKRHVVPTLVKGLSNIVSIAASNDMLIAVEDPKLVQRGAIADVKVVGSTSDTLKIGMCDWFEVRSWRTLFSSNATIPSPAKAFASPTAAYIVDSEGCAWAWGENNHNKLGIRKKGLKIAPTKIKQFEKKRVKQIEGNHMVTCFLTEDGHIYLAGALSEVLPFTANIDRYLPNVVTEELPEYGTVLKHPQRFHIENAPFIISIAVSGPLVETIPDGDPIATGHISVVDQSGLVFSWGNNNEGQCGLGWSKRNLSTPYENRIKTADNRPVAWVAAGESWTFFGVPPIGVGRGVDGPSDEEGAVDGDGDVRMIG